LRCGPLVRPACVDAQAESFGLAGFGYHARDEYVVATSIAPRLYLMTRLLTELGKE